MALHRGQVEGSAAPPAIPAAAICAVAEKDSDYLLMPIKSGLMQSC
jgi:hypothetical protein